MHLSVYCKFGLLVPAFFLTACGDGAPSDSMQIGAEGTADSAGALPGATGSSADAMATPDSTGGSAPAPGASGSGAPGAGVPSVPEMNDSGALPSDSGPVDGSDASPGETGVDGSDAAPVMPGDASPGDAEPNDTDPDDTDPGEPDPSEPDPNEPDPNEPDPNEPDPNESDPNEPDPNEPDPNEPDPNEPDPNEPDPNEPSAGNLCEGGALAPGFYVHDGRIYDNHCSEFVMRGVNYPYVWFKDSQNTQQAFRDIAATGANVVRVVLATGDQWTRISGSEITNIINWAKENQLVAMLEVHDSTGYGDTAAAAHPDVAVDYWLSNDVRSAIDGQEAFVMINIANEAFGNDASNQWEPFHTSAVAELRQAGLPHLFIVDAPNWGQDWTNTMRDGTGASNIFAADPARNTAFSVHMYDVYGTSDTVWSYFENFLGSGMALLVGEFAADHGPGKNVDEDSIMAAAEEHRIGYLGWSWSGNSGDLSSLDLVQNFNASAYSAWGQRLIDGSDGIRATSQPCRCFE